MISFGMSNILVNFIHHFYEYDGDLEEGERGLTIGWYEFIWLADLIAAYLLDKTHEMIKEEAKYHGVYLDNGFLIFNGVKIQK